MKWEEIIDLIKNLAELATAIISLIAVIIASRNNKGKSRRRK